MTLSSQEWVTGNGAPRSAAHWYPSFFIGPIKHQHVQPRHPLEHPGLEDPDTVEAVTECLSVIDQ